MTIKITRDEARVLLSSSLPVYSYMFDRIRNYEIEQDLLDTTCEDHVVSEWCPINGIFCKWLHHCSLSELNEVILSNYGRGSVDGVNYDYIANHAIVVKEKRFSCGEPK